MVDPLSDVLSLLKPSGYGFRGLDAGGEWSFAFAPGSGIRCYAVQSGSCWIAPGDAPPTRLATNDLILLQGRIPFRLYSTANAPATDAERFFSAIPAGHAAVLNGGGDCSGVGGYFEFVGPTAELLLAGLPTLVHIRAETSKALLASLLDRLMAELRVPQPGGALIAGHLAQTLLIEALRLHISERPAHGTGWLCALADRSLCAAMTAMHAEPARRWTLAALAQVAGLSRSSFAARFTATVGEPAMAYLTRWRMMLAADRLASGRMPVSAIAPAVGYDSESAFSAAFKRTLGHSPRDFTRALVRETATAGALTPTRSSPAACS